MGVKTMSKLNFKFTIALMLFAFYTLFLIALPEALINLFQYEDSLLMGIWFIIFFTLIFKAVY